MNLNNSYAWEQLRQFGSLSAQQHMLMAVWGLNDTGLVQKKFKFMILQRKHPVYDMTEEEIKTLLILEGRVVSTIIEFIYRK